ncbi:MAG: cupredoxin domain-containing protein [Myxococcota bacterium]|nr:cupredoxin domain-containing protein [Myxococcota bacterium]
MRALLAMSVLVLAVSCSGGDDDDHDHEDGDQDSSCTATTSVTIDNFAFSPRCMIVAPGATVTFTNADSTAHTASSNPAGQFDSGTINPGSSATITAPATAGDHAGRCNFHPSMTFTVRVE